MKYLLLTLLISLPVFSAYENPDEAFELSPDELDPSGEDIQKRRKEKYTWDESLIYAYNSDLGISDQRRYTGSDRNKLSASIHLNGEYEYLKKLTGLEVTWLRRSDAWHKLWWGATYRRSATKWDVITQNRSTGGEAAFQRPNDSNQTINTMGLGFGYRFKFFLDFLKTENVFESVQAFATYNTLAEGFTGDSYRGYGMTADYGIHKRTRTSFFYGGKFTYNISWVEGPQSNRNLSLGWYTFALELGFFY
ncbi:MAG: hypothetical protein K2P81_00065 [Bacteriovoracaceae bacterium]|nr:hypothetical protein [Bacteriovoracaceae bacterium]